MEQKGLPNAIIKACIATE